MSNVDELFGLDEKVAVVTGASSGLGVGFARALAGAGAHLVLAARRTDRLTSLAAELGRQGVDVLPVECDVTDRTQVDALRDTCLEHFGRVDVLVNNAGIAVTKPAEDETDEDFLRVMDVNLNGTFFCAQRFCEIFSCVWQVLPFLSVEVCQPVW